MSKKFHKVTLENLIVVPKIVTIHYLEFDRFFTYDGESHDFWELVYADKEDVIIRAENETLVLKQGEMIFHKPNEFHSLSSNRTAPPNVFIITFECKSEAMQYFENKKMPLRTDLKKYIHNIIKEAKNTFTMDKQDPFITGLKQKSDAVLGGQQMIRLNLEALLVLLLRQESEKKDPEAIFLSSESFDDALIEDILKTLQENIYGNINIQALCSRHNFGKSHLYNIFKNKTGLPLKAYYNNLKIDEAKRLLRQDMFSLTEISEQLCFNSLSYFCKAFKAHTGMTPKQYIGSVIPEV